MSGNDTPGRLRSRRTQLLVAPVVAALAGVALVALHPWRSDAADGHRHPASVRSLSLPGGPPSVSPVPAATARLAAGADVSPTAAVASFLRARGDGDAATSFALLSPDSHRAYPTGALWEEATADLPVPQTFMVTGQSAAASGTDVSVDVRRTPNLDAFTGFVPAHAVEVYRAVRTAAGWRVQPLPVRVTPTLISDRTAAADVTAWLDRLAACNLADAARLQASTELLGDDSLPAAICSAHARLRAGPAEPVSGDPATAPFLAAYGADLSWARLVPVTGGSRQLLVGVAPLGDSWRVFGIVPGGPGR